MTTEASFADNSARWLAKQLDGVTHRDDINPAADKREEEAYFQSRWRANWEWMQRAGWTLRGHDLRLRIESIDHPDRREFARRVVQEALQEAGLTEWRKAYQ